MSWGGIVSFLVCVLIPTVIAAIYYMSFASNQYVVQWRFTIRDVGTGSSSTAANPLAGFLGTSSSPLSADNYMVTEYIKSEQAVIDLEKRIKLRALYARDSIDYWSRIDESLPIEAFVRYWKHMVSAEFDQITGTSLAEIRAFSSEDAYLIASTLVDLTEELVNETSRRPLLEAVRYAETEVDRAQDRLRQVRVALMDYRNKAAVIEPNSSVVLSNATVASGLRQSIAQYQAELGVALGGGLGQRASQVEVLKRRIKATQEQLKDVESEIAKVKEGNQPLSEIVGKFEELDLERQFGQAFLTSAMQSLEQARANAMAKRLFIVPFVRPVLPQSSTYPKRMVAIATVAGGCTLLWVVALLLWRSIREHIA
jgi:capsular polysaccharide transport system permease protein